MSVDSIRTEPPIEIPVAQGVIMRRMDRSDPMAKYEAVQHNLGFWGRYFPEMQQYDNVADVVAEYGRTAQAIADGIAAPYDAYYCSKIIGSAMLHSREGNHAYLGYYVDHRLTRRHVGTRLAQHLVLFGLNDWGLQRINLLIRPGNEASQSIAKRLGAKCLGQEWQEDGVGYKQRYNLWSLSK